MHSKVTIVCLFALFLVGAACKKEGAKTGEFTYVNDFEGHFGYTANVVRGKSHSGEAFFMMDGNTEFSPAFIQQFKNIANRGFAKVKFSAYILMPDPNNNASLVIQVWDSAGQPIKVEQKSLVAKELGTNRWKEVSLEFPLAGLYAPDNQVRCFIHNPGRQVFYVDDFTVEFLQ